MLFCNSWPIGSDHYIAANEPIASKEYLELIHIYNAHRNQYSDINEHLPVLRKLATECDSAVEIGVRGMVSTWAILQGFSENASRYPKNYLGIDIASPPADKLETAKRLANANNISFDFWLINDMSILSLPADLLFIDSLHTYCHLTYELETFSPMINKYIAMHDTSEPWGDQDDCYYHGDFSEYPQHIDKTKRGLWQAVVDFLETHPEWTLHERHFNNHGFTVLKRTSQS